MSFIIHKFIIINRNEIQNICWKLIYMYLQNYNFLKIILHIDIYDCFFIIRKHISVLMNKKYYYQIKHLIICVDINVNHLNL